MRETMTSGDVPFRKADVRAVVERIEVDDDAVRLMGEKATLDNAVEGRAVEGATSGELQGAD